MTEPTMPTKKELLRCLAALSCPSRKNCPVIYNRECALTIIKRLIDAMPEPSGESSSGRIPVSKTGADGSIPSSPALTDEERRAMEWALSQPFHSVAADYSHILALACKRLIGLATEAERLLEIEKDYPNWRGRFKSLPEAIRFHTSGQDALISRLRDRLSQKPKVTAEQARGLVIALEAFCRESGIPTDRARELNVPQVFLDILGLEVEEEGKS